MDRDDTQTIAAAAAAGDPAGPAGQPVFEVLESISDAFYALDRSWRFTYLNRAAERLLQRPRAELLGRDVWAEFPAAVGRRFDREYRRAMAENVTVAFEEFYPPPLDGWFEVRAYPTPAGLSVYFQEVGERRRVAEELRRSAERYRSLVDATSSVVWTTDAAGAMTEPSASWEAFTGQRWPRYRGWGWLDAIHPEDRDRTAAVWRRSLETRALYEVPYRLARHDGQFRRVVARGAPVLSDGTEPHEAGDGDGDGNDAGAGAGSIREWVGTCTDVEDQLRVADARRRSDFRFQRLVEQAPLSIQIFEPDGAIRQVNRAWERLWGFSPGDLPPGFRILDDPQLAAAGGTAQLRRAFEGEAVTLDPIPYRPDRGQFAGQVRWVGAYAFPVRDGSGAIAEVVLVHNDVTERRAAEAALAENRARLQSIFDTAQDAIVLADDEGRYVDVNPAACSLTGWTRDELLARGVAAVTPMRDPDTFRQAWRGFIAAGRMAGEYDLLHKDGSLVPVEYRAVANVLPGLHLSVLRDVTGRRRAADAERAARLAAEASARASEAAGRMKDEFLATLSHELRTPLNAILGWSKLLRVAAPHDEAELAQGLETIERNARAQTRIIEDLLDMSRIAAGTVGLDARPTDLRAVLAAAADTVRHDAAARGVSLDVAPDAPPAVVRGDPGRLQQVFWNLFSNAVKFSQPGGRVRVALSTADDRGAAEVRVTDEGIGIAAEFLPYVFDRFRQADASTTRRHGGLGLGLAIAKQLVDLHGGDVRAHSAGPGAGATFVVTLPLAASAAAAAATSPADDVAPDVAAPPAGRHHPRLDGRSVLVVDDEADARLLVRRVLEDRGARVVTAPGAAEAYAALRAGGVDVLVCDVGMPEEDGLTLVRRVRALGPAGGGDVPAVALSAYARDADRAQALAAGYDAHLAKPFDPAALVAAVAKLAATGRDAGSP